MNIIDAIRFLLTIIWFAAGLYSVTAAVIMLIRRKRLREYLLSLPMTERETLAIVRLSVKQEAIVSRGEVIRGSVRLSTALSVVAIGTVSILSQTGDGPDLAIRQWVSTFALMWLAVAQALILTNELVEDGKLRMLADDPANLTITRESHRDHLATPYMGNTENDEGEDKHA